MILPGRTVKSSLPDDLNTLLARLVESAVGVKRLESVMILNRDY